MWDYIEKSNGKTAIDDIFAGRVTAPTPTTNTDTVVEKVKTSKAIKKQRISAQTSDSHNTDTNNSVNSATDKTTNKKQRKSKKTKLVQSAQETTISTTATTINSAKSTKSTAQETVVVFDEPTGEKSRQEEKLRKRKRVNAGTGITTTTTATSTMDDAFADTRGSQSSRYTEDGLPIYDAKLLRIGEGGDTDQCPFDCECCF
ncbi:hypothetical protein BDF19DRAFT_82501 [Syncephalis fuscata]|nr:hypothetical protein BDF19DRAFT_82501 [Syncephalis fuscata]